MDSYSCPYFVEIVNAYLWFDGKSILPTGTSRAEQNPTLIDAFNRLRSADSRKEQWDNDNRNRRAKLQEAMDNAR